LPAWKQKIILRERAELAKIEEERLKKEAKIQEIREKKAQGGN
jgi:hypothetical protein